eukprot:2392570-Amphidinium_carterae.1
MNLTLYKIQSPPGDSIVWSQALDARQAKRSRESEQTICVTSLKIRGQACPTIAKSEGFDEQLSYFLDLEYEVLLAQSGRVDFCEPPALMGRRAS